MEGHNLKPLSEVYNSLRRKGVTEELCMNDKNQMILRSTDKVYEPEEMCIVKSYRFEGDSNPDDNCVLYLLEANSGELCTLLDSYGADSNYDGTAFNDWVRKVPIQERSEFDLD